LHLKATKRLKKAPEAPPKGPKIKKFDSRGALPSTNPWPHLCVTECDA